jgi:hypothetical protein
MRAISNFSRLSGFGVDAGGAEGAFGRCAAAWTGPELAVTVAVAAGVRETAGACEPEHATVRAAPAQTATQRT